MREVKFRVWSEVHKKYFVVEKLYFDEKGILTHVGMDIEMMPGMFQTIDIKLLKLEQYTGIKDKNGVEIYEGDICQAEVMSKITNDSEKTTNTFGYCDYEMICTWWTVEHKDYHRGIGYYFIGLDKRYYRILNKSAIFNGKVEVVGNIHELDS